MSLELDFFVFEGIEVMKIRTKIIDMSFFKTVL
jgi:hypothetical protein